MEAYDIETLLVDEYGIEMSYLYDELLRYIGLATYEDFLSDFCRLHDIEIGG